MERRRRCDVRPQVTCMHRHATADSEMHHDFNRLFTDRMAATGEGWSTAGVGRCGG